MQHILTLTDNQITTLKRLAAEIENKNGQSPIEQDALATLVDLLCDLPHNTTQD